MIVSANARANPLTVYSTYIAVKLHFERGSYDAFKYNFKGPHKKTQTFLKSKDKYVYEKLAQRYPKMNELIHFFLANILAGNTWIRDMTDEAYIEWLGRVQSMTYRFNTDMNKLREYAGDRELTFDECLVFNQATMQVPILSLMQKGIISEESVVAIDVLVGFLNRINKNPVSDPLGILSDTVYRLQQYKPFIRSRVNIAASKNSIINLFTDISK
jgi:hypothetical protein